MTDRPSKRARASLNSDPTLAVPGALRLAKLPKIIDTLDEKTVRHFLLIAAQESSRISLLVESELARLKKVESAKTIDFGYHSKSVWRTLNVDYVKGIKDSRQWEMSGDAYQSVAREIADIRQRCPAHASYVTKYSALETLRKIGKIVLLSNDSTLGHEVQNSFREDSTLDDTMLEIVQGMSSEERGDMIREPQGEMVWMDKLKELEEMAAESSMFENLEDVVQLLQGEGVGTGDQQDGVEIVDVTSDNEEEGGAEKGVDSHGVQGSRPPI